MHNIEPHYQWRDLYITAEDKKSPFFGYINSASECTHTLYNFYLHPEWDEFGSSTLYMKVLFADYEEGYALIELIGEWNDTLHNDIMYLKRDVADHLMKAGISKFVFFCENVLNFHGGDADYYEEWAEEVRDEGGWIALLNTRLHVEEEMLDYQLQRYIEFGENYNEVIWRPHKPKIVFKLVEGLVHGLIKRLGE